MLNTQQVRAQAAVQSFDFTERLAEYGFATGTREDIESARNLISELVQDADTTMTQQITDCDKLGQNPYKRAVYINGNEVKVAMEIPLFSDQELTSRIARFFAPTSERAAVPKPNQAIIATKVCQALTAMAERVGYRVAGIEQNQDGSPKRIVLVDPQYAEEALSKAGEEQAPVSIAAMTTMLREHSAKKPDATAEALGLQGTFTADQVLSVRDVASELVEDALKKLMTHLHALKSSQVSPYNQQPFSIQGENDTYSFIDKPLTSWKWGRYVKNPVVVDSITEAEIQAAISSRFANNGALLNKEAFCDYVRQSIIDKLRSVPEMPLAMAVRTYYAKSLLLVFISPDAAAHARLSFLDRILGRRSPLALPAPSPAPAALPAPAPIVVPPVSLPAL